MPSVGATGFVGSKLLTEVLNRGLRNPAKLAVQHQSLTVVTGDANKVDELAQQLTGHEVVINSFNAG